MEDVYASNTKPYSDANEKFNAVSTLKVPFSDSDVINACQLLSYKIYPLQKTWTLIHLKLWNLYLSKLKKCELQNIGGWHAENSTLSYTFINYKDRSYIAPPFSKWKGL